MDMHHRLRRDPNWHPSGCNICGQLGHQAAQCTVGTIAWKEIYGEDAFVLRPPVYFSELDAAKKAKQVDVKELERRAREYAQQRQADLAAGKVLDPLAGPGLGAVAHQAAPQAQAQPAPVMPMNGVVPEEPSPLPEGWAVANDANGRPYFWHKSTKKVMWERPTPETPIEP